jgi:nucleotide-binding universal stress UspA family protein
MRKVNEIVCPIDFSPPSNAALKEAIGMAKQYGAKLILVSVVEPIVTGLMLSVYTYQQYVKRLKNTAREQLKAMITKHVPKGMRVTALVKTGDPADVIVRTCKSQRADLLVVATHGRRGWGHLIFGSVAEKVIRMAPCPVLVIHPPKKRKQIKKKKR